MRSLLEIGEARGTRSSELRMHLRVVKDGQSRRQEENPEAQVRVSRHAER